jgi:tellurite resistance protein TerC
MQSIGTPALWIGFSVVVAALLGLDLLLASRDPTPMSKRAAMLWTLGWVSLAGLFGVGIAFLAPEKTVDGQLITAFDSAMEFYSGYLIEYSLSIDNLFVFLLLFGMFKVPLQQQHRVLFWGIFGAVVLRAIFIFAGTALLQQFHWLIYLFGAFLLVTGIRLMIPGGSDEDDDVSDNMVVKLSKRFLKVSDHYDGDKFFTLVNGVRMATPLFLVLVTVELSDLVFAMDSIPAVFGVTLDPFIVYTSNIFAIMGLRSLFFLLSGALWGLRFLKPALGLVLAFVGAKMLLPMVHELAHSQNVTLGWLPHHISTPVSLAVVGGLLAAGIIASLLFPGSKPEEQQAAATVSASVGKAVDGDPQP